MNFDQFFERATGWPPYGFQRTLAAADPWPDLLEAPTGVGKTEAIVLSWLWRRRYGPPEARAAMPRRLAYCLPMRVLVEQTRDRVAQWLDRLGWRDQVGVHILMGGERTVDWDLYPEREAILIGTQDMLLSRALNRGYAQSRARWPMPFGLLNNDCLWVFDEVQLMGSGLATTAQLAAFRQRFGGWGACPTLWASATLRPEWLSTVDFASAASSLMRHGLAESEWREKPIAERLNAAKRLAKAASAADDALPLAREIRAAHQPGTLTLVVVNTVTHAVALYQSLMTTKRQPARKSESLEPLPEPELLLLHSRFRPGDREEKLARLLAPLPAHGRVVVATQVIEAGVDISARVLFTHLAPWASLVQRIGRCNRRGEFGDGGDVFWIDLDTPEGKKGDANARPYTADELNAARRELLELRAVGPAALRQHQESLPQARLAHLYPYVPGSVVRQKDVVDLFDTTADLSGADIDVSRFIREADEHDVHVFWRILSSGDPNAPEPQPAPTRLELCPAPLNKAFRDRIQKGGLKPFRWDFVARRWSMTTNVTPGQLYLLDASAGCYLTGIGWTLEARLPVAPVTAGGAEPADANDRDLLSSGQKIWQTIASHTDQVVEELDAILHALTGLLHPDEVAALRHAARWHDWGKAHTVFQDMLLQPTRDGRAAGPDEAPGSQHLWAKARHDQGRAERPGFRHELASALAMLGRGDPNLACYLVAAHHGKVRLSIRSMSIESRPTDPGQRFARGVWDGDSLPLVQLGGGVTAPAARLSLAPMELGLNDGQPSWAERALALRDRYGPFRLGYLETVLRAADMRASANPRTRGDA